MNSRQTDQTITALYERLSRGVDIADKASGEFTPFLNIMNEWYLRDCSRKQVAAYQIRGRAGKPNTANALYGYRKDPENKHHWLVDEETAAVVRRIFRLSIEGRGPATSPASSGMTRWSGPHTIWRGMAAVHIRRM